MKRKLCWFVVGFAAVLFVYQTMETDAFPFLVIAGIALSAIFASIFLRPIRLVIPILVGALFACIWMPAYEWIFPQSQFIGLDRPVRVVSVAEDYSYPDKTGSGFWCLCRAEEINGLPQDGNTVVEVHFRANRLHLRPGDRVEFDAQLLEFENTDDFLEFTYYKTRFIDAKAYAEQFEVIAAEQVPIRYFPKVFSHSVRERTEKLFGSAAGLIQALVTGNRRLLTDRQTENLRITGMSHVVAVSGMHVAFLVGFVILLFGRRRAPLIAAPIIFSFGMMIGPVPSVMRAIFMQLAVLFAPVLKKEADGVTSLTGALGFILFINPYSILDIGLQLSFGAALGLILYAKHLDESLLSRVKIKNKLLRRVLRYFISTFAASVCAMIFTTPLIVKFFGSFSWIAPLCNVMTLWSVSALFVGGIAVVLISYLCFPVAAYLAIPIKVLGVGLLWATDLLAKIPYALLPARNPIVIAFVVYAYSVFLWIVHAKRKTPRIRVVLAMYFIPLTMMIGVYAYAFSCVTDVSATILDVGHGQAILVESYSETVLIDCGSVSHDAASVVYEKLLERSERKMDALVLTHLDEDHVNGATEVMGRFLVEKLFLPAEAENSERLEMIKTAAKENGTEIISVRYGKECFFNHLKLTFYPVETGKNMMLAVNVSYGDEDLLITGDMDFGCEAYILENYSVPDVEHYVVGHHGSRYSSSDEFLDKISAENAYISVDLENQYGFPYDEIIEKLSVRGMKIFRTDFLGNIRVKF